MKFSCRTRWANTPNRLFQLISEKRRKGEAIFDLTESNPTRCGFTPAYSGRPHALPPQYNPRPKGLLEARQAISRYYSELGRSVDPEDIILTASTSEAYSFLLRLLCDPGDCVLAPRPSYPLFSFLADLNDVRLGCYRLRYVSDWQIDLENFEKAIWEEKPKAVIFVNPNNPTGNYVSDDEWKAVSTLCEKTGTAIISDEVFWDYRFAKTGTVPRLKYGMGTVPVFALNGISKILGLPQMKLSWVVVDGPEDLKKQAIEKLEIIADTYLSVNTPVQLALAGWMEKRREVQAEIMNRCRENLDFLSRKINISKPQGGWYAILKVSSKMTDEEFAIDLLGQQNVLVQPGYFYDFDEEGYLVLSLLPEPQIFEEGVRRLCYNFNRG